MLQPAARAPSEEDSDQESSEQKVAAKKRKFV